MSFLRRHYGSVVLTILSLVPIVLWLQQVGYSSIFESPGIFIAALGKAAALSGLALYALMPVLSMRHHIIERLFGGMDHVYMLHATSGRLAFFIILAHPILLGLGRWIDGMSIGSVWDWTGLVAWSGIVALLALILVTAITIYSHIRHQSWVWIHRIFGLLIPVFFAHALFARSQFTQNRPLQAYLVTIGLLGFTAFLYRSVFGRWLVKRYKYTVAEVHHLTASTTEFVLKPKNIPMSFTAGQHAYVSFLDSSVSDEAHPFSFSNANNGPYIRFTIKTLGDDTAAFQHIAPGTKVLLEGPYGDFNFRTIPNKKQVWIAGGVGITPFLSMARSLRGREQHDIRFFYGTESIEEAVFLDEFTEVSHLLPNNFKTEVVAKNTHGFITVETLQKNIADLTEFDYMICGPPGMMRAMNDGLRAAGVPAEQIHSEAFSM